jgi:oxygen-independent coproporphyrinogen-3 oxidase
MEPLSLYLHIPFCRHRCAYCDFNTYTTVSSLQEQYIWALEKEIKQVAALANLAGQRRPVHTLFIGGGTPSLLITDQLRRLLACARQSFGFTDNVEITLEVNPDTVDKAYLAELHRIGINRLSIGVQSALAAELAFLERTHDFCKVIENIAFARAAGFNNVSMDLIYGLPAQDDSAWARSLTAVLELEPDHLSLYCLTIEPGTPMYRWLSNGRISYPDPDLAAEQYDFASQLLAGHGFEHYEISNWAQPGRVCLHNLTYWRNQEYLGLGAGAHGQAHGYRYQLVRQPRVYIRRLHEGEAKTFPLSSAVADNHRINRREAMSDTVITQLRLLQEGLDLADFHKKFGQSLDEAYDGLVSQLIDWGLLRQLGERLLLSKRGRFISNQVFYRFL